LRVATEEDKAVSVDMLKSLLGEQRAEELMGTWVEEYFEKGRVKGQAEGRAEDVLRILMKRRVSVDPQARQRILSCTDLATLGLWLERAITAKHVAEVLDGPSPS
jgi:hypothetical protein